ncbi:MAG: carbohydrate kinase, partial [Nocardiopsis sp. BM-2018]
VGVARLGVPSGFIGKVGDDPFGHHLAEVLRSEGVDVSQLRFDGEARTALAFVSLSESGERDFMFYRHPSADMRHRPDELDEAAIRAADVLHVGSISTIVEPAASATRHAVRLAQAAGTLVSYDPNLRLPLWPDATAAERGIRALWGDADLIKVSDDELRFLTGGDDVAAARSLWTPRLRALLVTRGEAGVTYLLRDGHAHVPGFAVEVADTTGAGDAFTAAVLAALVRTPTLLEDATALEAALRYANAFAALTTTRRGAIPAMPDRGRVERFLADHADG